MNDIVLLELLEKAKKLNKAILLKGVGIDCEIIEPGETYFFQGKCLVLGDRVFDCTCISFARLTKNEKEREDDLSKFFNIF